MPASYEEINYSLRPAKQIERKMICEAMSRLGEFAKIESYRYIGFGSIYFSDFSLIHKKLNISNMVSIERDEHKRARFEFNKPFDCIRLQFGESTDVLPQLSWDERSIMWLDYDGRLDSDVLSDVASFCVNATSGSMLIVTVNAHFPATESDRLEKLRGDIGTEMVPIDVEEQHLAGWNAAGVIRRIITNGINKHLNERNGGRRAGNRLAWQQVLSFEYADGAKMTTIGGILVEEGQMPHFESCDYRSLGFAVFDPQKSYRIDIPALTNRELRYLDTHFPRGDIAGMETIGIPERDVRKYMHVYRYFPTFAEAEM